MRLRRKTMADEPIDAVVVENALIALPKELFFLTLQRLDVASIACLALCSKTLRAAVNEKLPAAQRKLRVSDFVRDPKLLAVGLATFEFPCVSLTAWAVRVGSVPALDYLWRIGFLDAKKVCGAAVREKDLAVLEWSLSSDLHRYWTPADCEAAAFSRLLDCEATAFLRLTGSDVGLLTWVVKNGCPCSGRDLAEFKSLGRKTSFIAASQGLLGAAHGLAPSRIPLIARPILGRRASRRNEGTLESLRPPVPPERPLPPEKD
jgi:hypothetical protein